jgi:uncharacterized protein YcsI (UPF0317 family)
MINQVRYSNPLKVKGVFRPFHHFLTTGTSGWAAGFVQRNILTTQCHIFYHRHDRNNYIAF